ncbi:MAG: hypothetical protein EBZ47_03190 [Chlamydiae bacterium]|nr:hypothetical protein [Chlamydiota bacterium]
MKYLKNWQFLGFISFFLSLSFILYKNYSKENQKVDVVVFSYDRPLQLYSFLESFYQRCADYGKVFAIIRASSTDFLEGYQLVKQDFPKVEFVYQGDHPKEDFKPLLLQAVYGSNAKFIAFAVDDIIVKDHIDFSKCMNALLQTDAWGFFLRLGKNIDYCYMLSNKVNLPSLTQVKNEVLSWNFFKAEGDWGYPNSLDMTVYFKKKVKKNLTELVFQSPNTLESAWAHKNKNNEIGLCFAESKIINIPLNLVNISSNRCMNFIGTDELLLIFKGGFKMDIAPLHKMIHHSPHEEYTPTYVVRNNIISMDTQDHHEMD